MGGPRARRQILSAALDQLAEAKPKLVAIDVILHDPGDRIEDARLEASLRATPNLILPSEVVDGQWEDPLPRFAPADPSHLGLVELPTDRLDGVTRQIPLERIAAHQHRWALSLVAVERGAGQAHRHIFGVGRRAGGRSHHPRAERLRRPSAADSLFAVEESIEFP